METQQERTPLPASGEVEHRPEPYQPDEVEAFLVARAEGRMTDLTTQTNRWQLERIWFENILFYLGEQWLDWDSTSRTFTPVIAPKWFPKIVNNEIYPRVVHLVAQFLKNRPVARVRPNTNEPSDREAARAAEQLLGHIEDVINEEELRHRLALGLVLTGTICSKEWFNAQTGPIMEIPETTLRHDPVMQDVSSCPRCGHRDEVAAAGMPCPRCYESELAATQEQKMSPLGGPATQPVREPVRDGEGNPIVHRFYQGEIQSEVLYPFEFRSDPRADTLERAEWCGQIGHRPLEWIRRNFPDKAKYVGNSSSIVASSFYQTALLQLVGRSRGGGAVSAQVLTDGAVVIDYEERPSPDFPDGLRIITADKVLLYYGPLPIEGDFSYSLAQYDQVIGRIWGTTPVEHMVPLNRRLNGIDVQIWINNKTMLNPWMLVPKGAGLKPGGTGLRPAAVVEYSFMGAGGTAPQIIPGQPLPAQIMQWRQQILDTIERIAGTQDVLRGDVPPGVKSGVALNFLGEQSETKHLPRARRWELFIAARGRKWLRLAQQHYREPRMVKVLGQGSTWQTRALKGADIKNNVDVVVEAGSSLPRSRTAQIQLAFDALGQGILGDPVQDVMLRQKFLEMIGLVGFDTDIGPDTKRALMENVQMDQGIVPDVGEYENADVHYKTHLDEMKSPSFDDKPPAAKRAYMLHVRATRQKIIQELAQEQAATTEPEMPPAPGGPDAGTTPPPEAAAA